MKFKYITYLLLGGLVAMGQTSCDDLGDEFLTQTNPNELTDAVFWKDLDACNTGLAAAYHALLDLDNWQLTHESFRSDIGYTKVKKPEDGNNTFYFLTWDNTHSAVKSRWDAYYTGIFKANQVIKGLEGIQATITSDADKKSYNLMMGQARFLRGFFHFMAHTSFNKGNIPIMDFVPATEAEFYRPCNLSEDVKEFFRADFEYARSVLPVKGSAGDWKSGDLGRVTAGAAAAYLGLSYLYDEDYDAAAAFFKEIIDTPGYALDPEDKNFTSVNEFNDEAIFEVVYTFEYNMSLGGSYVLYNSFDDTTQKLYGGQATIYPAWWLTRAFVNEPVDPRRLDSKLTLRQDAHGDIFYHHTPDSGAIHEFTVGTKTYHEYVIVKQYKSADNEYYTNADAGHPLKENALYQVVKKIEVDKDGNAVYPTLESIPADTKKCYTVIAQSTEIMPTQPYKGQRPDGVWDVYKDGDGSLYRYRYSSIRGRQSHVFLTDNEDIRFNDYGNYDVALGGLAEFKKWSYWDTLNTMDENPVAKSSDINFRVVRLADIYLCYAECLIKGGTDESGVAEAIKYINKVRNRAGVVLIGSRAGATEFNDDLHTFQGEDAPETPEDFYYQDLDGAYPDPVTGLHENSPRVINYTDLYDMGETEIISSAKQVMEHLMYFERPLELCLDLFSSRFVDLRRWGIVKERFADLANRPFTFGGAHLYRYEPYYSFANKTSWTVGFDYNPDEDYYVTGDGNVTGDVPRYEFLTPSGKYNDEQFGYFPIPFDEIIANPNIVNYVNSEGEYVTVE